MNRTRKTNLFLDYGELIFRYDFNRKTLLRAHKLALQQLNSQNSSISLERLSEAHDDAIQLYLRARQDGSEWSMHKIMKLMLDNLNLNGEVSPEEIAETYKLNDHDAYPMPTTKETLPELAKIGKLSIISNLPHDSLIYELKDYNLLNFFSTITISYQVGHRKPHPRIYQEALRRARVTPQESIFISHDEEEVDGARIVGMSGLLANDLGEAFQKLKVHQNENNLYQY